MMDQNPNLCPRCSSVQWAELADDNDNTVADSLSDRSSAGIFVAPLEESHQVLASSNCELCKLWAVIKPSTLDSVSSSSSSSSSAPLSKCHLRAFPSTILDDVTGIFRTFLRPGRACRACVLIGVVTDLPSSYSDVYEIRARGLFAIHRASARLSEDYDFGPRRILPDHIDFSVFKDCIKLCEEKHAQTCLPVWVEQPRGFRVIDCVNNTVVAAPSACRYAALSYVWGNTQADEKDIIDGMPLKAVPSVVEDSIATTLALGLRYLWVDRHESIRSTSTIPGC